MKIICLGVSYQTASVQVREPFAVAESVLTRKLTALKAMEAISEAVIVSTCNRVEFYAAAEDAQAATCALIQFAEAHSGVAPSIPDPFYALEDDHAIRHLFRVVSGLESMVLGETEILGQVKKAYAAAVAAGTTARHLNKLFQRAFNVAKEVRTRTAITRGPVSVGSVAVELAERIFGQLSECHAMILGAGETSELTARALLSRGVKSIFVANRTYERAAALAAEMGGEAIHFEECEKRYPEIDILISSTAAPHYIVTREKLTPVLSHRDGRPLFVIDLAVPRDVEPAVNDLEGAYLYDIDSLQSIAHRGMEDRKREVTRCEALLGHHVTEFEQWLTTGPVWPGEPGKLHQELRNSGKEERTEPST